MIRTFLLPSSYASSSYACHSDCWSMLCLPPSHPLCRSRLFAITMLQWVSHNHSCLAVWIPWLTELCSSVKWASFTCSTNQVKIFFACPFCVMPLNVVRIQLFILLLIQPLIFLQQQNCLSKETLFAVYRKSYSFRLGYLQLCMRRCMYVGRGLNECWQNYCVHPTTTL